MNGRSPQIAIAGAGIAGLTAALAFASCGFRVQLFERSESLLETGAGLQLSPNATRILDRLGVLNRLLPVAVRPLEIAIRKARSLRQIASVPLGSRAEERWGAPYLTVHRADLQSALLAAVKQSGEIDLGTGATIRDAAFHRRGVTLSIDRAGRIEEAQCDLAVGADGVWSTLRGLGGQRRTSRFTGHIAWRAMIRPQGDGAMAGGDILPTDRVTAFLHPGFHLVAYPLRAGEAVNLVAVTRGPATPERWSNKADRALLENAMKGASPGLVRLLDEAGTWTSWPIHEVDQSGPWTNSAGVALVGDAAHAMTPYAAQGAAMAIEDAATLAATVGRWPDDLTAALGGYEELRRQRVKRVATRGAFNRFTWHASGPVALARDIILRLRPSARLADDLDWLYGWDLDEEMARLS